MTPKFFWIAPTYRVNINLIFSLEDQIKHNDAYDEWKQQYDDYLIKINNDPDEKNNLIEYVKNNIFYHDEDDETNEDTDLNLEDIDWDMYISDYIYEQIGYPPDEDLHEYYIILSNGLKIQTASDKYYAINNIIDKYAI